LFITALWALYHNLAEYNYDDIVAFMGEIPGKQIALALALTALSYGGNSASVTREMLHAFSAAWWAP
jgi:uncharacterized membrane protein YbhN (UPF0104 family)